MKNIIRYSFNLLLLFTVSSCSSLISKDDCKKDMSSFGLDQGKRGLSNLSEEIRRVCDENVSLEAYQTGFNTGWSDYCTSFHGFEMGKKGDIYKSFCPAEKEELFHEKFLIGKTVYERKDQIIEVEEKIKDLLQNEKEQSSVTLTEELKRNQDYLRTLKREIQALEQKGLSLIHTN